MANRNPNAPDSPPNDDDAPNDAVPQAILMRLLPPRWHGLGQLARLDRPIGTWLLFWPCFWGLALAAAPLNHYPPLHLIVLFFLGALVMRGAGCTFNDIIDRKIDAKIARTASRPLPAGRVGLRTAIIFLILQLLIGLVILLQFNGFAIMLGVLSLVLVAIYPFMKRVTWWPQFFLGLAFNWGALLGYAAMTGRLDGAAFALYAGGIFWTLGYDTIYAHQDREDDALIGVKSAARRLAHHTKPALIGFYSASLICLALAGALANLQILFWAGLVVAAWHLITQIHQLDINKPHICLLVFRSNRDTGLIIAVALVLGIF